MRRGRWRSRRVPCLWARWDGIKVSKVTMAIIGCYATALPSTLSRRLRAGIGSLLHLTPRRTGAGAGCTPSPCEAMRAAPQTLALGRGLSADLSADLLVLQQPLYLPRK